MPAGQMYLAYKAPAAKTKRRRRRRRGKKPVVKVTGMQKLVNKEPVWAPTSLSTFMKNRTIVPKVMKNVKLVYEDNVAMTPTTLTAVFVQYSANGIFDPYVGVGGHQPMGFDQITPFYQRYRVTSSRISMIWNPPTLENIQRYFMRIFRVDDTTIGSLSLLDLDGLRESGSGGNIGVFGHVDENAIQHHSHCEHSYTERSYFGKGSDVDTSSLVTANPANGPQVYYIPVVFPTSSSNASQVQQLFRIRIEYTVTFSEPKTIAGS